VALEDLEADYCRKTTEGLGQLTRATTARPTAIADLTQANASPSTQLGTANTNIKSYHTHGPTRNDAHTSTNCRNPSNGHTATVTLNNCMGGSKKWCANK
jgi:hypothetical protein